MSFFGYLAAGAAEGAGRAGVGIADQFDKRDATLEAIRERQAGALELARQREQDRADRERENLLLRAEIKGAGSGAGGGKGGFNLFQMAQEADTPEKQTRLIDTVRGFQGDETANVVAQMFGRSPATRMADPARESVTGYTDATGGMDTAVPGAVAVPGQMSKAEAEKGRRGLQRLFALVNDPGKYDDFAKGEARVVGTDAVLDAGGDDGKLRKAGAVNMALEGKDRFGVQGDQSVDKALGTVKQTDLGNAKASDERASAGEHSAKAGKARAETDGTGKAGTAADKLAIAKARERRLDIKDQISTTIKKREQGLMTKDEAKTKLAELESQQLKYDRIIEGEGTPAPAPSPAPTAAKPAAGARKVGEKQVVQAGPNKGKTAVWDGKGWKLQ